MTEAFLDGFLAGPCLKDMLRCASQGVQFCTFRHHVVGVLCQLSTERFGVKAHGPVRFHQGNERHPVTVSDGDVGQRRPLPHTLDVGEGRRPAIVSDHLHDGEVANAPSPETLPQQPPSRQVFITPLLGDKTLNL